MSLPPAPTPAHAGGNASAAALCELTKECAALPLPARKKCNVWGRYKYWMDANLIKELASLRSGGKAIRGVYVMPSHETLQVRSSNHRLN